MHLIDRRSFLLTLATAAAEAASRKHLLLDDRVVERVSGAALALGTVVKDPHNPLFREDRPWEARFDNLYANVHYDAARKLFQCCTARSPSTRRWPRPRASKGPAFLQTP